MDVHFGRNRSIRRFMVVWIAVLLSLLTLTDGTLGYRAAVNNIRDTRDRALGRVAAGYLRALRAQDGDTTKIPPSVFREELGAMDPPRLRFRVSDERGGLLVGDPQLKPYRAGGADRGLVQAEVYDDTSSGERLRVAVVRDYLQLRAQEQAVAVQVAEPYAARMAAEREVLLQIALRHALRLAILLGVVWLVIRIGLRPVDALRAELKKRRPKDLTLVTANRPAELAPIVSALNELLLAQQASIDEQRKFLSDASHQLRTPLTVLKAQAQGLLFGQTDAADILPKMLNIIDRATGLTNQLLAMAKAEQLVRRGDWREVQLEQVARDAALEFAPLIARKRLDFSLQATPVTLTTDAWLLGELVKNLLSNAIHHSKKGGALGIVIRALKHETEMIVWDHGGGVAEDVLERLFEPFTAARGGSGIGLGLSICRQIADSMHATVDLFNRIEAGKVVGVDAVVRWQHTVPTAYDTPTHLSAAAVVADPAQVERVGLFVLDRTGVRHG